MNDHFTEEELKLFHSEGWGIFDANGDYQLQRLDEEAILPDDKTAWKLVRESNAPHHIKALEFLKEHSPAEYELISH